MSDALAYGEHVRVEGVESRLLPDINGLTMHVMTAGRETDPMVLLLHGFPELAYSWRKIMRPLADAGYFVVAPDQRGYGRTTGWQGGYDDDLAPFRLLNLVRDVLWLLSSLGRSRVRAVVGHDFGSPVAAWCALTRPDVFASVVMMSSPFGGLPTLPLAANPPGGLRGQNSVVAIDADLAALSRPRKHYQWYYSSREADGDMLGAADGVHQFLRDYYHHKSADWSANTPYRLDGWDAESLARMPTYYIMDRDENMAETVAHERPTSEQTQAAQRWLSDDDLQVYSNEFERNGFQGGLQWYRCGTDPVQGAELMLFAGRTIDVPACFIAGASDWGIYQFPGAFESMQTNACTKFDEAVLLTGAGHWVQQEQSAAVVQHLLPFLARQH